MLRRHIVLFVAIRPSDEDVKPAFREEQAMSRHRVSPSPFLSSSSHTTQILYINSYTYSHHNLNFLQHYTESLSTRNVVCPSGAWYENRPHSTPSICLVRNPKRVIVQWVGIRTHTHTHTHIYIYIYIYIPLGILTFNKGHTLIPRVEIKIRDHAWNGIRVAGLKGRGSIDHATATNLNKVQLRLIRLDIFSLINFISVSSTHSRLMTID